jgi:hypothetical protein
MKHIITFIGLLVFTLTQAQIGSGWDWAFNPGSLGAASLRHISYKTNGGIYFGGQALAAAKFGSLTISAPAVGNFPGTVRFFGSINAQTGAPTIVKWYANGNISTDCITTDDNGNFVFGGNVTRGTTADFGDGVTATASITENLAYIAKMNSAGVMQWVKTYNFGGSGVAGMQITRLAVSDQGNIFFVGWNTNAANPLLQNQLRYPIAKLDANGNTVWMKEGGAMFKATAAIYNDKFVDSEENLQLIEYGTSISYSFNGETSTAPTGTVGANVFSHHLSLTTHGVKRFLYSYRAAIDNVVVQKSTNNVYFVVAQYQANSGSLTGLPASGALSYIPYSGIVETNKDGVLQKASGVNGVGNLLNQSTFIPISGGRLAMAQTLAKTFSYAVGVDYWHPADPTNNAMGIIETDDNWQPVKMITSGKSPGTTFHGESALFANNGDNYVAAPYFGIGVFATTATLPTTSFGTQTLTGFNAANNFTSYATYGTSVNFRNDLAFVHTNSNNFPMISTTTWLGNTANWNDATNWTNGVPTNLVKAVFNGSTTIFPSTFPATPTSASIQVNAGATVTLPTTLALSLGIRNNGKVLVNNAGFFQGFGAKNWIGTGELEFTGTNAVSFFYTGLFTNALTINGLFSTFYDINTPAVVFKSAAKFDMGGKTIAITSVDGNAISGVSANNYFYNGTLRRSVSGTGTYEFPVGTSSSYQSATVQVNNLLGTNQLSAKFTSGSIIGTAPSVNFNGVPITNALNAGFFTIDPNVQPTGGSYNITLSLRGSSNSVTDATRYTVIKRNNSTSAWAASGTTAPATVAGSVVTSTVNNLSSFSDFAIGFGAFSLPVSLTNFTATLRQQKVALAWATANELNNRGFYVQHSVDGVQYTNLGFVAGKGTTNAANSYGLTHYLPVAGVNYYRLKQVDMDGKELLSPIQTVYMQAPVTTLQVYPNPVAEQVRVNVFFPANSTVAITNTQGRVVLQTVFSGNTVNVQALPTGNYFISFINAATQEKYVATILKK